MELMVKEDAGKKPSLNPLDHHVPKSKCLQTSSAVPLPKKRASNLQLSCISLPFFCHIQFQNGTNRCSRALESEINNPSRK